MNLASNCVPPQEVTRRQKTTYDEFMRTPFPGMLVPKLQRGNTPSLKFWGQFFVTVLLGTGFVCHDLDDVQQRRGHA